MRLIVSADDFGFDEDTVAATIDCLEAGTIRNTSLMANMPATKLAADYAADHPEHCYGVHLTFTRDTVEMPVLDASTVPRLVDEQGRFLPGRNAQFKALLSRFPSSQIAAEMAAQIGELVDLGVRIDYVDSHKHLHKYPNFRRALPSVLPKFGISMVRTVQNVFLPRPSPTRPTVLLGRFLREPIRRRWRTTDDFFMSDGDLTTDWWSALSMPTAGRVLEVGAHPGRAEPWRAHETDQLTRFAQRARSEGAELIRWRDL
ncbi:MAG: ChbG/HpnK family deacetylase [Acidimicrobiales bacterium]